jgi:hypothetical protein
MNQLLVCLVALMLGWILLAEEQLIINATCHAFNLHDVIVMTTQKLALQPSFFMIGFCVDMICDLCYCSSFD